MNNQKEIKKYSTLFVEALIFVGITILIYLATTSVIKLDTSETTLFILYLIFPLACGSIGLFFRFKPRQTSSLIKVLSQIISGILVALIILEYLYFSIGFMLSWVT